MYLKQEGELGTMGILFCVKLDNNYILKLRFMKHLTSHTHAIYFIIQNEYCALGKKKDHGVVY